MLDLEELEELYNGLIKKFPFILINNSQKGFEEADIKEKINEAWDLIPLDCKKRREDIIYNLTIHLLIKYREITQNFEAGDTGDNLELDIIEVGDIKTSINKNVKESSIPLPYRGSRFGSMAWYLVKLCSRSKIGIMV